MGRGRRQDRPNWTSWKLDGEICLVMFFNWLADMDGDPFLDGRWRWLPFLRPLFSAPKNKGTPQKIGNQSVGEPKHFMRTFWSLKKPRSNKGDRWNRETCPECGRRAVRVVFTNKMRWRSPRVRWTSFQVSVNFFFALCTPLLQLLALMKLTLFWNGQ